MRLPVSNDDPLFKKVWDWKGPIRLRAFLWKLIHGKLLTNVERNRRGMTVDVTCPRSNPSFEAMMHLLRDYEEVIAF